MGPHPKITVLGLNYPPESSGIAPYTGTLAATLSELGYPVVANVAQPHYPGWRAQPGYRQWSSRELLAGVEVRRRRHFIPRPPRGARRLVSELSFGIRLFFASWGPRDVVIAISPALFATAIASVRRGSVPFIVWVQDVYTLGLAETREGGSLAAWVTEWVESWTLRRADQVVVIHERISDYVIGTLGVKPERVKVIRNWTHLRPIELVDRQISRDKRKWVPEETIVLHAGNMGAKQGLDNVIEAARIADQQSQPVRFVLLGDGGERDGLRAAAAGVKRIEFLDPLPDIEFRAALSGADILLVNELSGVAQMAMPSKLTSYFDAGRPVVAATDPAGITASELIKADAGIVVPAGNPQRLLDAINELRTDPDHARRLGANGRHYRETVLDQSAAIKQWVSLLDLLDLGS